MEISMKTRKRKKLIGLYFHKSELKAKFDKKLASSDNDNSQEKPRNKSDIEGFASNIGIVSFAF